MATSRTPLSGATASGLVRGNRRHVREQLEERALGDPKPGLLRYAVEQFLQGVLGMAVSALHVRVVRPEHDVPVAHRVECRYCALVMLEGGVDLGHQDVLGV